MKLRCVYVKRAKTRAFTPDRTTYLCYHARRCRVYRAAARYSLCEDAAGNASNLSDYLPLRAVRTARDDPAYPQRSIVKALYLSISITRDLLKEATRKSKSRSLWRNRKTHSSRGVWKSGGRLGGLFFFAPPVRARLPARASPRLATCPAACSTRHRLAWLCLAACCWLTALLDFAWLPLGALPDSRVPST